MKTETGKGTAEVKDYSNGKNGSEIVNVEYDFTYDVLENAVELAEKFSPEELRNLANQRIKASANSVARQKAVAPYAQDPNAPSAIADRMVKDAMKLGHSEETARKLVESLLGAAK